VFNGQFVKGVANDLQAFPHSFAVRERQPAGNAAQVLACRLIRRTPQFVLHTLHDNGNQLSDSDPSCHAAKL
jgi:hypothetical protein